MKNQSKKLSSLTTRVISLVLALTVVISAFAITAAAATAAEEFILSVEGLEQLSGNEWADAVDAADAKWQAYLGAGGSAENSEVADAYAVYAAEKALLDDCLTFVDNYNSIANGGLGFVELDELMEESNAIFIARKDDNKFNSFEGVGIAISNFGTEYQEFVKRREFSEKYVANAALAAAATTYGDAKKYTELANDAKKRMSIPDYPLLAEAEANIEAAKDFMADVMMEVLPFLQAVGEMESADDKFSAILAAMALNTADLDSTAEGVAAARLTLNNEITAHNEKANSASKAVDFSHAILGMLLP